MFNPQNLDQFIKKANIAHQQLCVWFSANNELARYQKDWDQLESFGNLIKRNDFKYENFWNVVLPTLQHSWVLSTARLLDPAYHYSNKKKKNKPRICLDYILSLLSNKNLEKDIRNELTNHQIFTESIRQLRRNVYAHNDAQFKAVKIEAGVEKFFDWLEKKIEQIKQAENCSKLGNINTLANEELSRRGVDNVFKDILAGRRVDNN